jgi:hypothetical protein
MKYLKYKKYQDLGEWWEKEGRGKFPVQICIEIAKMQKKNRNLSFQEAFEYLMKIKAILFLK